MNTSLKQLQIPVSYVEMVNRLARYKGLDSIEILAERLHLSRNELRTPETLIDGIQLREILNFAQHEVVDDCAAQRALIEALPLTVHGYVGLAIMSADTLGQAIDQAVRWHHQTMPAGSMRLEHDDGLCRVVFSRMADFDKYNALFDELYCCVMLSIMKLTQAQTLTTTVELIHSNLTLNYLTTIYPNVLFSMDCSRNSVAFSSALLDDPIPTASSSTLALMEQALVERQQSLNRPSLTTTRVRAQIEQKIRKSELVNAPGIAALLNLSERSLRRKLRAEETSLKSIHDHCRTQFAQSLLTTTSLNLARVSEFLGFSSEASFSRFFSQQTGISPKKFRDRVMPGAAPRQAPLEPRQAP